VGQILLSLEQEVTSRWSSIISRDGFAGRGPIKLPASAPARNAALKMTIWRIRMKNPPKGLRRLPMNGGHRAANKNHTVQGTTFTLKESREVGKVAGLAAVSVTKRSSCQTV